MEELKDKTTDLIEHVEDIASTYYKLALVTATQKATNATSMALVVVVTGILGFSAFMFFGMALSWWLGTLVNSRPLGFVLGALFFLLVLIIVIMLRKKIIFPLIRNLIIRKTYEQEN